VSKRTVSFSLSSSPLAELWQSENILIYQVVRIGGLVVSGLLVLLIEMIAPSFFTYPYFSWSIPLSSIARFWPLFVYAVGTAFLSGAHVRSSQFDETILGRKLTSSVLAGIWEEVGFRCLYICFGMIAIVIANWFYSTFLGILLTVVFLLAFAYFSGTKRQIGFALLSLVGVAASIVLMTKADPLYWFYQYLMIPVLHFVSIGFLDTVLYGASPLFVMGAILANSKFRDGHKYQGPVGMLNAWIVGFILLHAAVTYGLLTAITVHALYDVLFSIIRYVVRKING